MSSPFATFRKHRTYWMAGLVLLAILAFVVAPGIESAMSVVRNTGATGNDVVVRWSGGKVTSGTLDYVRRQHARTTRFLHAVARDVIKAGGMPKVPGFRYDAASKRVEDLGLPMLDNNRAVCQTMIIAERAKQLGIEFDKAVIDDFLKRFCDRKISSKQFEAILKETAGRELSVSELYRQLGLELSAVVMERLALAGVNYEGTPLVTPGSLWQNYLRLNQAARIEAFPILTREFTSQVKEKPTDAEIRALYETGSANFPSPNSPEPGFRRRYQANIEYVSGSWNKLLEVEKAKITEEALKAEYDRLVALGGLQVPVDEPKPTEGAQTPATDPANPATGAAPETPPAAPSDDKPAGDTPPAAALPSEGQAPSPGASEAPAAEKSSDETGSAEPPKEEPASETPAVDPKSQSRLDSRAAAAIRLVSFQQDQDQDPGTPPPVADPSATDPTAPAAQPSGNDSQKSDAPAASTTAPATGDAAANAQPSADPAAAGIGNKSGATTPMRTQTFEEAKDSLARSLATNVVRDLLQTKLDKIESAMRRYEDSRALEKINAGEGNKNTKVTEPINLKKLAEAEGLTYGATGLSDGLRMATSPIGRSMVENRSLVNEIMTPNVELFKAVRSVYIDMENLTNPDFQQFVSWKTEQELAYTPALTDIRDEVADAWRMERARTLAREEATKLADKVRKAGDDAWKSVLDAQQQTLVISPTPFTWMNAPREMFAPAEITFVQGLDSVGPEFMQHVFSTSVGELTVAPNQGLTTYYVVRVVELTPTLDQLRQNFELSRGRARQLSFPERERLFSNWYQNIERALNVQWMASDESLMN